MLVQVCRGDPLFVVGNYSTWGGKNSFEYSPDGTIIGPPMPFEAYRNMSDRDAQAIVAYLRTVLPITSTPPVLSSR